MTIKSKIKKVIKRISKKQPLPLVKVEMRSVYGIDSVCAKCNGTGRHLPEQTCPICNGSGR